MRITEEIRSYARELAGGRCECVGANCRHHRAGGRCKHGLRPDQWKVYWRSEKGGISRPNLEAWCLECFDNNFTIPTTPVAVLLSQIADYAVLADRDRRKAITLTAVLRDAADLVAENNQGRLLAGETGLVQLEFPKSAHAVDAARGLHDRFRDRAHKLRLPVSELCSGIHQGEVTRSRDGDVYGETLSVASLLNDVAAAGQIVLSTSAVDQLGGRVPIEDLGERTLVDLTEPVRCWALSP